MMTPLMMSKAPTITAGVRLFAQEDHRQSDRDDGDQVRGNAEPPPQDSLLQRSGTM